MARLMVVLKPSGVASGEDLIPRLLPTLARLDTEIDHQGKLHLSGLLRIPPQGLVVQLFADVQPQADGPELDVVLMSAEAMTKGAPQTHQALTNLIALLPEHAIGLELTFRSDRDGPLPLRERTPLPARS
ncbi:MULTISPECIES: hypothetical protein [Synechococcales]|uniref:hypothetical protein n=2 Tax=unclassified Synechococcus TaxID=2626047 RepID=UPI0021A84EC3|nr:MULTISPECIES: hypothetical protein [unclassified Synechococcus]MCT0213515.1 hypothetical protein [Synechococcus sp. CS-1326]